MRWELTKGGGSGLHLVCFILSSIIVFWNPNFTRSNNLLFFDTNFVELIVITTSEETCMVWNYIKTPAFTIMMRDVDKLLLVTFDIKCDNSTVVVSNDNLVMHHVNG